MPSHGVRVFVPGDGTQAVTQLTDELLRRLHAKARRASERQEKSAPDAAPRIGQLLVEQGDPAVTRALRNQNVWLAVAYVGLLLLMAHAQV